MKTFVRVVVDRYDSKILLGKFKDDEEPDAWGLPGCELPPDETPIDCAKRYVKEQLGQELHMPLGAFFTYDVLYGSKRFVTLYILGVVRDSPELKQWDACSEWGWFRWTDLPSSLTSYVVSLDALMSRSEVIDQERKRRRR